jgi:ribonuclease HII
MGMQTEEKRIEKMSKIEKRIREAGYKIIAGIDEAGRGPLAGPVVAAACILPEKFFLRHLNDSKLLTPTQRKHLYLSLTQNPDVSYGIGIVSAQKIDEVNILQATFLAMQEAISALSIKPDYLLFDGKIAPRVEMPHEAIVDGDSLSVSIAAASVIAKYTRDQIMDELHLQYPQYGFNEHKGYGTKKHQEKLILNGPCAIHRKTFEPIKSYLEALLLR